MTQPLPAHLQNYQTPDIGGTLAANLGSAMPPHVTIGGNRFTLVDASNVEIPVPTFDPQLGPYLDAAIIDVNPVMSRIYFGGNYDPTAEGVRPDCFSDNGIGPSVSASSPQAPTCAACPRSEWTKVNQNGKKVPWCTQKQKVALLIPGFQTLFLLAVPPNSHGPLREYVNLCKGNGANIADLLTRIWFVSQGTLGFRPVTWIDAPTAQLRQAAYIEKKTDALVGRNDTARPAGAIAPPVQQVSAQVSPDGAIQSITVVNPGPNPAWPPKGQTQQVQQPGPFAQQIPPSPQQSMPAPPIQGAGVPPGGFVTAQISPGWLPSTGNSQSVGAPPTAASPSDLPGLPHSSGESAPARRRRRTAAEMAAAAPQGGQQTAAPTQAPFPHPGQTAPQTPAAPTQGGFPPSTQPGALPGQTDMGFGIAQGQPAAANPDVKATLDAFFQGGGQ
jgi:hypothetical protein